MLNFMLPIVILCCRLKFRNLGPNSIFSCLGCFRFRRNGFHSIMATKGVVLVLFKFLIKKNLRCFI